MEACLFRFTKIQDKPAEPATTAKSASSETKAAPKPAETRLNDWSSTEFAESVFDVFGKDVDGS